MITYRQTYIDSRWPVYLKEDARLQLIEYGYITMDEESGYPVEMFYDDPIPPVILE